MADNLAAEFDAAPAETQADDLAAEFEAAPAEGELRSAPVIAAPKAAGVLGAVDDWADKNGVNDLVQRGMGAALALGLNFDDPLTKLINAGKSLRGENNESAKTGTEWLRALAQGASLGHAGKMLGGSMESAYKQNEEEHPVMAAMGSMAIPLPDVPALAGIGKLKALGRMGVKGAEGAAINAFGGDESTPLWKRLLLGAGIGAGAGALAEGAESIARAGEGKVGRATEQMNKEAVRSAEKADTRASGVEGGRTAAVTDAYRKAKEIVANGVGQVHSAEDVADAQALLDDPDFIKEVSEAYRNTISRGREKMGLLKAAQEERAATQQARTPEAIQSVVDERLKKNALITQGLPRLKTYAERAIPAAVGGVFGGPLGVVAGSAASAAIGKPGTAIANALKNPETTATFGRILQNMGGGGAWALRRLIPASVAVERARQRTQAETEAIQ